MGVSHHPHEVKKSERHLVVVVPELNASEVDVLYECKKPGIEKFRVLKTNETVIPMDIKLREDNQHHGEG
jgi:hypothetical protein